MPVFQVATRRVTSVTAPPVRRSRALDRWFAILRYNQAVVLVGAMFGLTISIVHNNAFFILLPIGVSIAAGLILGRVSFREPGALLCFIGVAVLYFGGVTGLELATHGQTTSEIIVVTTTLTIAVVFEPLRGLLETFLGQHFHLRETATSRAIAAFTAGLREEIDLDAIREGFLDIAQQTLVPQSAAVWVRVDEEAGSPDMREARRVPPSSSVSAVTTVIGEVALAETDPLVAYLRERPGAVDLAWLQLDSPAIERLRSDAVELVLPLVSEGTLLGLLALGPRIGGTSGLLPVPGLLRVLLSLLILGTYARGRVYSPEDRALLETLAVQMAPAVRVAQLVSARRVQDMARARIEGELHTAQQIQRTFLPKEVPSPPGWQLTAYYQPAREVGGDFYDFHQFEDGRLGLVIGDVTGKGIPAALIMTAARTMLRTATHENASPGEVLERVNDLLCADIPPGMFVTCFYALLDPGSGGLRFANAGQDLPYLRSAAGAARELHATGMPLGLMLGTRYQEGVAMVEPGESLLFYSDGVVEAHNARRDIFGERRLAQAVEQASMDDTQITSLLSALAAFTGADWEQEDDVTLLLVERRSEPDSDGSTSNESAREPLQAAIVDGASVEGEGADNGAVTWNLLGEWRLESVAGSQREAIRLVDEALRAVPLPAERRDSLKTAVAEATMNATEHGNAFRPDLPVTIAVFLSASAVRVSITDEGGNLSLPETPLPDLDAKLAGLQSPRGWGLFLIQHLVDEVRITGDVAHRTVELILRLPE